MKSTRTSLAVLFLLTTIGAGAVAYKEYLLVLALQAKLGGPDSGLEKQLTDDERIIKSLRNQLAALGKPRKSDVADAPGLPDAPGAAANDRRAQRDAMRALVESPQFQALRAIQEKSQIDARYAALFKSLNLTPAQVDQVKNLLIQRQQATADAAQAARAAGIDPRTDPTAYHQAIADAQSEVDKQLQTTLGDAGYAQYQQYTQTLPQRTTVNQLQTSLSYTSTPLTDEQSAALIALMPQGSPTTNPNGGNQFPGGNPFGGQQGAPITAATITQAASVLSAPQLQALQQLQQSQQAQQQMQQLLRANQPGRTQAKGG